MLTGPDPHDTAAPPPPLAARVRVVLVGTQHPGNVGAAARAMKTMGLTDLALVAPRRFPHAEAEAMAAHADDLLEAAAVHADLRDAIAGCTRVVATTARPRSISVPVSTPREWATRMAAGESAGGRVALVFGRERTGLTNQELELAQEIVVIPTGTDYASLNLAAAVQVLAYELCATVGNATVQVPQHVPVDAAELERFFVHLETVLVRIRFLDPDNPRFLMRRLRRLFGRAAPDANETNILRGILTAVEASLRR
jgi:tRNA/rRNA methyltransferase/tRNA (cytidine32/uridine32-2'-O)-methyltransferase